MISKVCALMATCSVALASSYYSEPPLFSMAPDPGKSAQPITRFGPVGMSLELIQPAFTIRIGDIEEGSPAAATGKLKKGQIIQSINGEKLADIDPRIQLGNMITAAEAKDGVLKLMVSDKPDGEATEVVVKIPALGAYSATWPLDCPKSDKIVRNYAEYLKRDGSNKGFADIGMLFLLSTGDESDLPTVREWARSRPKEKAGGYGWQVGYGGLALCEYYLRTGDAEVLPAIQALADHAVEMENFGGWANKGSIGSLDYGGGGGHLSASGVLVVGYLMLAKECGAEIPEETLLRVLRHWYRWAGRGNVPYGNSKPEGGYTDNGKNGKLAFSMAAAASLTPDGEKSLYAGARDISARFSFQSTSYMLHGHTGGGIGEIWRSGAMGLLQEKRPRLHREFMDQRRWHYEMSRRFDGSFGILGGLRYDNPEWGAGYALTYTIPRKTLRITGAPRSKFSKPHQLPARPWGTAADDAFVSLDAIALADGSIPDFSSETIPESGGMALLALREKGLGDDELNRYIRHPNYITRTYFSGLIAAKGAEFIGSLLREKDARLRRLGVDSFGKEPGELLTDANFARLIEMIADPEESWFVKEKALVVIGTASPDRIAPHVDVIIPYLHHEEWWLQNSALVALTPVATDKRCYERVLPAIGKLLETNYVHNVLGPLRWGALPESLREADPEVAELARQSLKEAYSSYVDFDHVLPQVESRINPGMRDNIATAITQVPGGYDLLYEVAKQRKPGSALPYENLFLDADPENFSAELKGALGKTIETRLIPRYIGENRHYLVRERDNIFIPNDFYYRGARVLGLVDLYRRIGVQDYNWKDFGPKPTDMAWHYLTFDPKEAVAWDDPKARYREVTLPAGAENWFKPEFDAAKAGWKTGLQPFGATNGELKLGTVDGSRTYDKPSSCPYDFCRHHEPLKTLWDKEVLLMKGKFKFPELKDGHRYRLNIGGMSHVGAGEGYRVYVNGELFTERDRGVGRREGGKPIGRMIDKEWWDHFNNGEVEIAHVSFMNIHRGMKNRHLMIWVQEMKLPPMGDDEFVHSATVLPMTSADWQARQDPDNNDLDPEEGKFLWDGKFVDNPALIGKWKTVAQVNSKGDFDAGEPRDAHRARLKEMTFEKEGRTADPLWIWSGGTLMDLRANQALKMQLEKIDGTDYLFIESGGFHPKHGMSWQSPWIVMTRN